MKKESKFKTALRNFTRASGVVLIRTGFRLIWMPKIRFESENARKTMKSKTPLIIISNHCYWFDPVMMYLLAHTSKMSVVAAKEVMTGFKGILLKALGCIPVDRTTMDLVCLRECAARVRQGERVGIFPEGMINFEEEMLPFKAGVSLISAQTGAPVVPVYISGDYRPFGKVQVLIGDAVDMSGYFSTPATAAEISAGTDALYERMCSLKEKLLESMTEKQRADRDNFRAEFMVSRASAIEEQKESVNK
ncbi:MAG: 1-acyl-sn-glycerol-3-phosphate acyltransferase [Ruminococcus sp.]|nr:1-acyl-sn-glycerol-3-phosphate acyltransferase [Ruminococcus sp.]